jgi:hypothetical protein
MCTVSFIPIAGTVYLTHNRDERATRLKALPPRVHNINGHKLLFPRDGEAGGSWVAINENGNAAVLLNGGIVNHINEGPYRKSRGIVFLELVATANILLSWEAIKLDGIEPFSLIVWNANQLFRCVWDGNNKHQMQLNAAKPHTWSSVTLYDFDIQEKRKGWFEKWLQEYPNPVPEAIIGYHLNAGDGDANNDLKMNRAGQLLTVSLTAITITGNKGTLQYLDLLDNNLFEHTLPFIKAPVFIQ